MAICKSCSAPLPANTNFCQYCGVRNDIDLQDKQQYTLEARQSERICPVCHVPLQTINLKVNGHLYIDRCASCFGLFFDPGEIEILLDNTISNVTSVNWELLDNINQERYPADPSFKYLKCPVCQVLMNRVNFGYRSGVVVDQCKKHGVWLDSGEITHLMEWKKAGGELLDHQQHQGKQAGVTSSLDSADFKLRDFHPLPENNAEPDLLKTVLSLVFKPFE